MGGRRLILLGTILAAGLLVVSCGGGDNNSSTDASLPTATAELIRLVVPTREPGQIWVDALWFADETRGWAGGTYCGESSERQDCIGLIFATNDGGRTWTPQYRGNVAPMQLQFVDSQRGMALGYAAVDAESGPAHVLVTQDGGLHWKETYSLATDRAQLALAAGDAWIVASRCARQGLEPQDPCRIDLLRSSDDGDNWTETELPIRGFNVRLSRPTPSDAWLVAMDADVAPVLMVTRDAGAAWTQLAAPWSGGPSELFFRDAEQGWALVGGGPAAGSQPKEIFATRDGGQAWVHLAGSTSWRQAPPTSGSLTTGGYVGPMVFTSSTEGWMALARLGLLHSSDGGVTWQSVYQEGDGLYAVQFVDPQHGWAHNKHTFIATDDGGSSWRVVPVPTVEGQ